MPLVPAAAAVAFMLIALMLSLPAVTGTSSVLQSGVSEQVPVPTPEPPVPTENLIRRLNPYT